METEQKWDRLARPSFAESMDEIRLLVEDMEMASKDKGLGLARLKIWWKREVMKMEEKRDGEGEGAGDAEGAEDGKGEVGKGKTVPVLL
jgi:hypothetical protein